MPRPNKFAAVDTAVLLALEAGDEECQEAIDELGKLGFFCLVSETPFQEIGELGRNHKDLEVRQHASATLVQMANFGFLTPPLSPVQLGVAEQVAKRLTESVIHTEDTNDALTFVEAAYNECRIFVTRRECLLTPKRDGLSIALSEFDLFPTIAASPKEVVEVCKAISASKTT